MLYNQFGTNKTLEKEGVWLEYGQTPDGKPVRIKVARAGGQNLAYQKQMEKATRPHKKALQTGTLDNAVAEKLFREVYADSVIVGWENITDADGKPLVFSRENVVKVMEDLPDLFADIREAAANMSIFRDEERKADLGN